MDFVNFTNKWISNDDLDDDNVYINIYIQKFYAFSFHATNSLLDLSPK